MSKIIRVIDLETTGFDFEKDAICEVGWCDVNLHDDLLGAPAQASIGFYAGSLINPKQPIPPVASSVHHLIDEDVHNAPSWLGFAETIKLDADGRNAIAYAAHNAKFEAGFIKNTLGDLPWICTYKCALRLWQDAPAHSNMALRYWRRPDGLDREVADRAHRAMPDAYVTAFHLRDMINAGTSIDDMIKWSSEPALLIRCHIGKNRGLLWTEVDEGFLWWLLDKDFDEDVLFTARHELDRREQERKAEMEAEGTHGNV